MTKLLNNILPKIITEDKMGLLQPEAKCKQQNRVKNTCISKMQKELMWHHKWRQWLISTIMDNVHLEFIPQDKLTTMLIM